MKKSASLLFTGIALSFVFAVAAPAANGPVFHSGDWRLDDSVPADPGKGVCQASTTGVLGNVNVTLSLSVDKTGARPLELLLLPAKTTVTATSFMVKTDSGATYYFAKLPRVGALDQYWHVPVNTAKFVADLSNANQLVFRAVGGSQSSLPLSMSGSTAVINELQKRCTKNSLYTAQDFEKAFLPANSATFHIASITPAIAAKLRNIIVASAVPAYIKMNAIQLEMNALEAKFAPLTGERRTLTADLNHLQNFDIPALNIGRDNAQAAIDKATGEINDFTAQIPLRQADLVQAQTVSQAAQGKLAPLKPEHDRLLNVRNNNESNLAAARSNLADIDNGIMADQQFISQLTSELNGLNNALPDAQNQVSQNSAGFDQANRAYQSFDPRREVEERMHHDDRVRQLEQSEQQWEGQAQAYQQQVQQFQGQVQGAQGELNAAQAQAAPVQREFQAAQAESQAAAADLQATQGEIQASQGVINGATGEIQSTQAEIQAAQNAIPAAQNEAQGAQNDLQAAQKQVQNSQGAMAGVQAQAQAAQGELQAVQNEAAPVQKELQGAQSEAQAAGAELQATQGEIQASQGVISSATSELQAAQGQIQQAQSVINSAQSAIPPATAEVQSTQNELAAAQGAVPGAQSE
ncbi:MAG: hypothetical protein ACXVB9_12350, partial [Bdellovibrionota bacterium]